MIFFGQTLRKVPYLIVPADVVDPRDFLQVVLDVFKLKEPNLLMEVNSSWTELGPFYEGWYEHVLRPQLWGDDSSSARQHYISRIESLFAGLCKSAATSNSWIMSTMKAWETDSCLTAGASKVLNNFDDVAASLVWIGEMFAEGLRTDNAEFLDDLYAASKDMDTPAEQMVMVEGLPIDEVKGNIIEMNKAEQQKLIETTLAKELSPWVTHIVIYESNRQRQSLKAYLSTLLNQAYVVAPVTPSDFSTRAPAWSQQGKLILLNQLGGATDVVAETLLKRRHVGNAKVGGPGTSQMMLTDVDEPSALLKTWPELHDYRIPSGFEEGNALVINVATDTADVAVDKITTCLGATESGNAFQHESGRMHNAWGMAVKFEYNALRYRRSAVILHYGITFVSVLTTFIIVLDAVLQTPSGTPGFWAEQFQNFGAAIIALPLLSSFLFGVNSRFTPSAKFAVLLEAAYVTRSQIYQYRTRVGRYAPRRGGAAVAELVNAYQMKKQAAREAKAQAELRRTGFAQDAQRPDTAQTGQDVVEWALARLPTAMTTRTDAGRTGAQSNKGFVRRSKMFARDSLAEELEHINNRVFASEVRLAALEHPPSSAWTSSSGPYQGRSAGQKQGWCSCFGSRAQVAADRDMNAVTPTAAFGASPGSGGAQRPELQEDAPDDGISMMTADDYMKYRLIPLEKSYQALAPWIERQLTMLQVCIFLSTTVSTVLAALGFRLWIAVLFALASAFQSIIDFEQVQSKLVHVNAALTEVRNLRVWWQSLNMYERRMQQHRETLVHTTEEAVMAEVNSYLHAVRASSLLKRKGAGDAEDEGVDYYKKSF
eukprot:TRINITY_DN30803_c0_g1_i2.p1 TRINITY_DN30803_c0_g1~~TRINITY_DN30803_c0_g1_i2.p1  ORF type:complete len:825 (-),score=114.85 TRINITY_DN30803_c0_g1_i2:262-2736(-)